MRKTLFGLVGLCCVLFTSTAISATCDIDYTPVTGNSIQNSTPTPENPVDVISFGDKTKNLASGKYYTISVISGKAVTPIEMSGDVWITDGRQRGVAKIIEVEEGKTYTVSMKDTSILGQKMYAQYASLEDMSDHNNCLSTSNTIVSGAKYALIGFWGYPTPEAGQTVKMEEFQIEEGSTATSYVPYGYQIPVVGTSTNGSRTTTSVYLNAPLRKVGNYADVLDYKNGTITRNVGAKVLDGTNLNIVALAPNYGVGCTHQDLGVLPYAQGGNYNAFICSHLKVGPVDNNDTLVITSATYGIRFIFNSSIIPDGATSEEKVSYAKSYLAQQYAAGTPVIVYYPLATPVVEQIENWSCIPPITDIKIATTKMVDDEFAAAEAQLATTVQTIESVVSRTIAQTGQIATLHETKQTRPDESCPANKKCLLVEDEQGIPHWYEIIEP